MQPIQASQLIPLSIPERARLLKRYASLVNVPADTSSDLHTAYQIATVLTPALPDFIQHQIQADISLPQGSILQIHRQNKAISSHCRQFASSFISAMPTVLRIPSVMESKPINFYEICGAIELAKYNEISRKLSTSLGKLWEIIANISPYAVSPEMNFGLKLKGIDSIVLPERHEEPIFVQIKTQRNTLTGGHKGRVKSELSIHQHSCFVAAFCVSNWAFLDKNIPRVCLKDGRH